VRDGFKNKGKVFRPTTPPAGGSPLIVFAFGGGFISGDPDSGTALARAWVRLFGAVVVCINYRLSPEYRFPIPMQDGIDNGKWLAEHAADLKADPSKGFIIGGISAGGTQTALMTLASISEPFAHPVTGQWLCVPSLMNDTVTPEKYKKYHQSLKHNHDAPILSKTSIDEIHKHLQSDQTSPLRFPVLNKDVPLSKLPPTFLQADGLDPLRDDALIYEEMLKEAGVKTRINFYPGCPHAHFALMPGLEVSNTATADVNTGIGWLLGKTISNQEGLQAMAPAS
jgi:acetyl esterase/lipase